MMMSSTGNVATSSYAIGVLQSRHSVYEFKARCIAEEVQIFYRRPVYSVLGEKA